MSPNAIRKARPGFILIFAGALATSGAVDFGAAVIVGGDCATFGAAGGADAIFGAGGGAGVVNFATGGGGSMALVAGAFDIGTFATFTGVSFDTSFDAAFFGAGLGSDFWTDFAEVVFRAAVSALNLICFFGAI